MDWYCCCSGAFHMRAAARAHEIPPLDNDLMKRYLMIPDEVLFLQAAIVIGEEGMKALSADYKEKRLNYEAARCNLGE